MSIVTKLSNPHQNRVDIAQSLFGILPADITLEEAKAERAEALAEDGEVRSASDKIMVENREAYHRLAELDNR